MNKKLKTLPIIMIFLLAVIMPFVKVDAAIGIVIDIMNPGSHESFPYSTGNEVFKGDCLVTGLAPDTEYFYQYWWKIDDGSVDLGSGYETTTGGGSLHLTGDYFDTTVDISSFETGEHNTNLKIIITLGIPVADDSDTHDWTREEPTSTPEIVWNAPASNWLLYNYSTSTEYTVDVDVSIEYGFIDNMWMWVDDILNKTWTTDKSSERRTKDITIDSETEYNITIKMQSEGNVNYTSYRYLYGILDGSNIVATMYSDMYANGPVSFDPFTISNTNGLDNCTIFIDFEDVITTNQVNSFTAVTCNLTYDQLVTISDYYQAINLTITYDKVQIWGEDYYIDDSGDPYYEFTDGSEHVVDSGDYYNSVDSYEEDDMSIQAGELADWYNSDWSHRVPITVTYSAVESYATVNHTITSGDPVYAEDKANGDDWVMTEDDGETVVSHWIETYNDAGDSILWFNATDLINGDTVYYLYYGNAGASNSENPSNVFDAWDDFDTGYSDNDALDILDRGWEILGGAPTIQDVGGPTGMVAMAFVDDSEGTADVFRNNVDNNITNAMIHYDIYWSDSDSGQSYFSTSEGTTVVSTCRYESDNSYKYYVSSYDDFVPAIDFTPTVWYELGNLYSTTDYDVYVNGVGHDGALRNAPSVGVEKFSFTTSDTGTGDLNLYIDNYYVYSFLAGMSASTGSEVERMSGEADWNVGEHFTWTSYGNAVGERNETYMSIWDNVDDGWAYVWADVTDFQLDAPIQNSAYSWEVRVSTENLTKFYAMGFSVGMGGGKYLKMGLQPNGYVRSGVSTACYSSHAYLTNYYTWTDISYAGEWVTLNVTVLPDIRVIYFVDDVIVRDSYLDDSWFNVSDPECGNVFMSTDTIGGDMNATMFIDYFNTTDYGDGHQGSGGQTYSEYSDPSVVVYNGSRWLANPATPDASAIYSGNGGSTWLDYYDSDSNSFKTRFRLNTEDITSYSTWLAFKVGAKANATDDWWYSLRFNSAQTDRIYFSLDNHTCADYDNWLAGGYLTVDNNMDGDWHTYEIQIVKDSWVAGFYDGVLVANVTDSRWLEVWDTSDADNGRVSHSVKEASGYNSSTIEIDYWSEKNWTYNWWMSNNGWGWSTWSDDGERTNDGELILWKTTSDYHGMYSYGGLYPHVMDGGGNAEEYALQIRVKMNDTETDYEYISLMARIGTSSYWTANVMLWQNDTATVSVFDNYYHHQTETCYETTQISYEWVQDQWYILTLIVDHTDKWITGYIDGQLIGNLTVDSSRFDYSDYNVGLFVVDGDSSATAKTVWMDYFKSGWAGWEDSDATTAGLTYDTTPSLPANIGQDYYVNWTSTQACRIWGTITTGRNLTGFSETVFTGSGEIEYDSTWVMNSTVWDYIVENTDFVVSIRVGEDLGFYDWLNITLMRDTIAPTVTLNSPEDRSKSDPYSNLQIIPLDYDLWDLNVGNDSWTNDMKILFIDDESFTGDDWAMYPKHKPLQFWEDWHTLIVGAWDDAENYGSDSATFYYEERLDKPLTLTFTSSIDDETIDPEQYLNIYLDGMPISSTTTTNLNDFTITVYDKFGILLNSTVFDYEATIDILVPLRPVTFENNNDVVCKYRITYGLFEKSFWIQADTNQTYYLNDTDYILVAEPGEEYFNETHWYGQTYISFTVEADMESIEVILDLVSDDPLHDPLRITVYDKEFDISGYVYIYYETSWENTTVRVFDNDVPLGSAKSEGYSIWLFDTEDYGFHNITIFIKNGEDVVFSDGFSFTLTEPEANPNYYLTIHTSTDVSGGVLYVTVNTDWGNCTIRVFDNNVPLGGNTSEGSSVWYFDEEVFGLHNFTIEVYQGNDLWDTIVTSITIMAPDAETLSLTLYSVQFDSDSSYIYINYQTTWGNTTVLVLDNGTELGDAQSGEELSIWTTTTDYGWHNITVIIYDDEVEWFTDEFSFTIVAPSTETNYFEALSITVDSNAGQLYTSIHTYWGNCTVGVKDNSSWLGDNTTEGDIIWTFSTDYGFHNFSIYIYQNEEIWHIIYTSITIVEPTPEESMLFTLFEKSVDADSGLFYLNYETNWGNTTCRVKDNSTWLGDNTTEQLSIWSFTTNYGLHNITIEIYSGNDLVYTDVTSFVIQEPDTEINYYLTIDTSVDVDSGLLYITIETYFGNCTIRARDNSTWLGANITEGSSIWSFDQNSYGLHNFSIFIYQSNDLWNMIYTSITIVEPDVEVLALTLYDKIIDADAGLIYINYETNWGNTTIRVMDNTTWIGSAVSGEENSIWTFTTDYGLHNITVVIYNDGVPWFTDVFSFTIIVPYQIWKELTFIFTSSYDSAVIPAYDYLDIYLNDGMKYIGVVQYDVFNISVYDRFGQLLYEEVDRLYSETISIALPLRNITFINSNPVTVSYIVTRSIYSESLLVATGGTSFFYLKDATYPISVVALEPCSINGYVYTTNTTTFVSSVTNTEVNMTLGTEFVGHETSPMTLTFRSSFDSGMIDPEYYLDIYLDGGTIEYHFETWKTTFNLTIYDKFNNLIYENTTFIFATTATIYLPLREISFTNSEFTLLLLDISTTSIGGWGLEKAFASQEANSLYLYDCDYTFTYIPMDEYKDDDELYVVTTVEETTSATNNAFTITLKTKRERGIMLDIDWTNLNDWGDRILNGFLTGIIFVFGIFGFIAFMTVSTKRLLKRFVKEEKESDEERDEKIDVIYKYADKKLTQEEVNEEIENTHRKERDKKIKRQNSDPEMEVELPDRRRK